ncbi:MULTISPECIES: amino acid ABC transporter ATP-binding protein [Aerococcus]|uniref:amino acid ABC transporter ATP-binding protein n=1 Tax=Aerococcus TaxID=1375 RepID=UPI000DCD723E|nr:MULTISPECIES: ATP-binding cassette domain-containing protein [Aerococcus]MDL5183622.1 ATP-binding cassette domain-containing protein [Aerococcus mictus]MDK6291440.1 ATP-binding cassette domain-containing protein [Aerococcus urinae]MDK6375870.1 ATP-binding cassette domain-containing protein [Aerococcus urinae]MDK6421427.1 ATP-binding cassette domain-containing protein [Aerococcus urinae]MDK8075830.1 ATP-binding cassette domain-containing protein [Aerococcus urinae]
MALIVSNLKKAYNGNMVIDQFNCRIDPGEIVILLGPSGTGKTTFMRLINNLEKCDQGNIAIGDRVLCQETSQGVQYSDKASQRRYQNAIGMVFQNYQLFPNFTVLDNVLEAPIAQKLAPKSDLLDQAMFLLDSVGLKDKANAYPSTLSGGQKQRVAIARAMMLSPEIICFDEPTSALDRESANQVGKLVQAIAKQGKGILVVTHDTQFGQDFGTRIVSSEEFK